MSAFVVGERHINLMLTFDKSSNLKVKGEHGQALLDENLRSVNQRYGQSIEAWDFTFKDLSIQRPSPVEVLKLCQCYEYNAGCHMDYKGSPAHAIVKSIMDNTIKQLPGYEEAAWEAA